MAKEAVAAPEMITFDRLPDGTAFRFEMLDAERVNQLGPQEDRIPGAIIVHKEGDYFVVSPDNSENIGFLKACSSLHNNEIGANTRMELHQGAQPGVYSSSNSAVSQCRLTLNTSSVAGVCILTGAKSMDGLTKTQNTMQISRSVRCPIGKVGVQQNNGYQVGEILADSIIEFLTEDLVFLRRTQRTNSADSVLVGFPYAALPNAALPSDAPPLQ
jgi:hypothetical protein